MSPTTTTAIVNVITVADCSVPFTIAWVDDAEPDGPPAWNDINVIRESGAPDSDERVNIHVSDVVPGERRLDDRDE